MAEDKRLFLLDGHALMYRAHYAFINRPLINSKGMNTSAITGFTRTLWDLLKNENPTHIAVAFDPDGPTFRHERYEEYKANRDEQPEDIAIAYPYIKKIVEGFNIPILIEDRYEADDVIGTLAKKAEQENFTVYMVTPDKDFMQLVTDKILMYKPSRQGNGVEIYGPEDVLKKWKIQKVEQVIDSLGMQGDTSDNIPGIPGIGPKTSQKLLKKYGSLEGVLEHTDELSGKMKERVIEHAEQARLSKELATIDTDAPVDLDPRSIKRDPLNREKLAELFKELEFRTLAKAILGSGKPKSKQSSLFEEQDTAVDAPNLAKHSVAERTIATTEHDYSLVQSADERSKLIEQLSGLDAFCFDVETTSIDPHQCELVGIAFSWKAHEAYYIPIPEDREQAKTILGDFRPVFESEQILKVAQNIKYDAEVLHWYDIDLKGHYYDTMIAHYLLEPELRHSMDYLSETYLKYKPIPIKELIGTGKNQKSMREVDLDELVEYAGEDADITWQLKEFLEPKLKEEETLEDLYWNIEEPLIKVLIDLECAGVKVDRDKLDEYSRELGELIQEVQEGIYEKAGTSFNIASPKQVGEVLFEHMSIPYRWKKTKSGQYSTSEDKLQELSEDYDIVDDILEYRGLTKLKSTYVDALPEMINPKTGCIHSSFNQALAATGRLSSKRPNLQNIPIRTAAGRKVRKAFVPRSEEYTLLAADYSQVELRIIASISGDDAMMEAFNSGQDIHRATAARVFDTDYEEVTDKQRYQAKTVNFSIIYGAGSTNLSQQLDISRSEAKDLIDQYFEQYSGLKQYMEETVQFAREHGYVKTLIGRRRQLRDINSRNNMARSAAERIAINTPIQGTAADMIKIAMIDIHRVMKEQNLKSYMILQVHDELVFDVHKEELEEIKPMIDNKMKNAIPDIKVPILVEMGTGNNWLEAH